MLTSGDGDSVRLENVELEIRSLFSEAIREAFPQVGDREAIITRSKVADYQCNSVMSLIKLIKFEGRVNPEEIARAIVSKVRSNRFIGDITVTNGFINIKLSHDYIKNEVRKILSNEIQLYCYRKKKVVIDYSSPNIAKEMHVGHLRSTIIGDCLANILEFLGNEVVRVNHVGDWGTQFGMLLAHLVEKFPDYALKPPPISDLQVFYKEAKKRFDEEPEFKKIAYQYVVRLQSKEAEMINAWNLICDISRREFKVIYDMLGIQNLIERGESFYHDMMKDIVKDLEEKNLLQEDEGRRIMFSTVREGKTTIPLTVVKSDGGYTYDTSDMACIKYRIENDRADRIIYVTDEGQSGHFEIIFDCARQAGYVPDNVELNHVGFGVVLGEDGKKFKTRSGDTVKLKDLLDEGMERSMAKLVEKGRDKVLSADEMKKAQSAVAIGCIKYSDLSNDRIKTYQFSFNRMLDDRGNTAVYLLYSLARINSIIRKAEEEMKAKGIQETLDQCNFSHVREWNLAKNLLRFAEVLHQISEDLYPHSLCSYLFELSVFFSEFYEQCYCIEKNPKTNETRMIHVNRVMLCRATAKILRKGLNLLGIETIERM